MTGSRLSNLTCVVTGAASGIGRSIALRYAEEGAAFVVCADLMEKPSHSMGDDTTKLTADSAAARLTLGGTMAEEARNLSVSLSGGEDHVSTHELICQRYGPGKATYIRCDVSLEEADQTKGLYPIKDVIQTAVQTTGRLDVIVNCAGGVLDTAYLHEASLVLWEKTFAITSRGAFLGSKYAIQQYLKQDLDSNKLRGCIINISSVGGSAGLPGCAAYCAAKASILGLSRIASVEYADQGIRSNCISPGYIYTPMLHGLISSHASSIGFQWLEKASPSGRLGQPRDIAEASVWLASNRESGYVTGIDLHVDGGFLAK